MLGFQNNDVIFAGGVAVVKAVGLVRKYQKEIVRSDGIFLAVTTAQAEPFRQ